MNTAPINWNSIFETGNKSVDNQHKQLFELIKDFSLASTIKNNKKNTTAILFELEDYTKTHFNEEEKLLSEKEGLPSEEHIRQHQEFVQLITDLKFEYVSENKDIENDLFILLTQWLKDHILNIDQKELNLLHY